MKKFKLLVILGTIAISLFINVQAIDVIDQPGPRPTGICPIEKTVVKP